MRPEFPSLPKSCRTRKCPAAFPVSCRSKAPEDRVRSPFAIEPPMFVSEFRAQMGSDNRMSATGPSVWTGRALQAENDDLEMIGLALLYPASKERLCFWPSWIIRARSISFASRPRRPEGPPDHERAGETFSPSPHSDSQTSAGQPIIAFGISLSRPLGATVARSPNRASGGGDRGTAAIPLVNLSLVHFRLLPW